MTSTIPSTRHPSTIYQREGPADQGARPRLGVAFLARVSTDDQQDPTLSLPRQLANCQAALPTGWEITAWFWDIESGRTALERRGRGHAHERIDVPLPRDGGLIDLLEEAAHPRRRFDVVICESIDRIARRTYIGTRIENELEQAGVRLYAADEPIDPRGKRSTGLLTRRVKQGVAEWYVTDMLERSWDGFKIHTAQGWNIGKPPYGYTADKVHHPVPAKAAEGLTKTRLIPDPQKAPVVAHIFQLRAVEQLGYDAIAARLNADLDEFPVPEPTSPHRQRGTWSGSAVRDIVTNPKYTGYMVWNRRASKDGGKINPPGVWIWSDHETHEPLVSRERFEAAAKVAGIREGSRTTAGPNLAHRLTKRGYLLRSYVRCGICNQRMHGKMRHDRAYYCCRPATNNADQLNRYEDHPKSIYVREEYLREALDHVIATRVFGADRQVFLRRGLADQPARRDEADARRTRSLHAQIADLGARQDRLISELETTDVADRSFRDRLRRRFDSLEAERAAKVQQLAEITGATEAEPDQDSALVEALPILEDLKITDIPEAIQRKLYDAFQLEIHYDRPDQARIRLTLTDDNVGMVAAGVVTRAVATATPPRTRTSADVTAAWPGAHPSIRQRSPQPARTRLRASRLRPAVSGQNRVATGRCAEYVSKLGRRCATGRGRSDRRLRFGRTGAALWLALAMVEC